MSKEKCPLCGAALTALAPTDGRWPTVPEPVFECGTSVQQMAAGRRSPKCYQRELSAMHIAKARLEAELAEARMRAAGLVCCLRAYDGSAIPASDARDAFAFLAQFAGKEVIDAAWYGAGRRAGREEEKP